MPTHQLHKEKEAFYFVTFTCYKWLPLLKKAKVNEYLPKWVENLEKRGLTNCAYVMMPNHLHLLVYVETKCNGLNKVLGEGKRFLAYEIVSKLKEYEELSLLEILSKGVQEEERKKGKKHQVFRLSFDAKLVEGEESINKVLDYIHHNPVSGKWDLVTDFMEYSHSSARFYELDEESPVKLTDYRKISESSQR